MDFDRYLGDGVYAIYDGYQIWLAVNHHANRVVALEPPVVNALMRYVADLTAKLKEMDNEHDKTRNS